MSWVVDNALSWIQLLSVKIVKTGGVPRHIAFIMDGNRRFANKSKVSRIEGHSKGFDKLAETLQWCLDLGIPEVTVYAFSIENFKRSPEEVEALMRLTKEKFQRLIDEVDRLNERGWCVRVVGNLALLPVDVRQVIAKAVLLTKDNAKARLNVALPYTARDEMTRAIVDIADAVKDEALSLEDVSVDTLSAAMELSEPELLIRTSGEVRISDFMMWQCTNTMMYFSDVLWPEFSVWRLLLAIIHYQIHWIERAAKDDDEEIQPNCQKLIDRLDAKRLKILEEYAAA